MKKEQVQTQVAEEDVDDVVEIALRLMQDDEGALSMATMKEVGAELDIPAEYIERAQKELETQRAQQKVAAQEAAAKSRKLKIGGAVAGVSVIVVLMLWSAAAMSSLGTLHADATAQLAQVENVQERKEAVEELYRGRADSPDRDAELIGAENRIRVESKRYAEIAARYNEKARSFPNSLFLSFSNLPDSVPTTAP